MRILIYDINFSPESVGIGKYTGEMAEWLADRGHEVRVVTTPPHYPHWKVFKGYSPWRFRHERWDSAIGSAGTLRVIRCPVWLPREPRGWKRVVYLASFALSSLPAMLLQIPWRPDVVLLIEPTFFCSPQALCAAWLSGATAWLHVQDFEVDIAFHLGHLSSLRMRRLAQALERFLLRKFDRVSAISDRMVERLSVKGVESGRSVHFPNWVDTSAIYPLAAPSTFRQELGISERMIVALYSGSMGMKHGLGLLVEASRQLAFRTDIQFVFCGDGPCREVLFHAAERSSNVILLPLQPVDRLNDLLNLADIHLLPQLTNAEDLVMPSKLTGMMASGRAIVATAHSGTQIASALEGRGMVTPPGDDAAFVAAVLRLAEDPDMRHRMGDEARQYAVTHMDRDEILDRFELSLMRTCGHSSMGTKEELSHDPNGQ